MIIFSHRGNLNGKLIESENTSVYLSDAVDAGFNVEFDINFSKNKENIVLSHDEADDAGNRNISQFLKKVKKPQFHALNVKNLQTIFGIINLLNINQNAENFFWFDFELLCGNINEARFLMNSMSESGYHVAYRLSEKENYYSDYLNNDRIKILWMDEFSTPWIQEHHIKELAARGKKTFYVSPELHGDRDSDSLFRRWEQVIKYGISGICTDFPLMLKSFIGANND